MAVYADNIQAKVNGTAQAVPLRDSDAQQQLATKAPGIIETASEESIQIADSSNLPLAGLRIYGKGVQDGTPSSGNPVPINIPGEDGNINVNIMTNQLSDVQSGAQNMHKLPFPLKPGTYTVSFDTNVKSGGFRLSETTDTSVNSAATIVIKSIGENRVYLTLTINFTANYLNVSSQDASYINNIMLNVGDSPLPFEKYELQTLLMSTPNGLTGIPVSSGGNYTDASGQQRISDIYDVIAGKYHHYTATIDSYNGETITTPYLSTTGALTTGAKVIYALETPTVESVESFTANSYYPNTNIFTDDTVQPGIEVDYVADTKLYIDNKVSAAVTQAVAISQA